MDIADLKKDIVFEAELRGTPFTFHSTWGLFSPKNIDEGTKLLIETVAVQSNDVSLDLGCGYGALGLAIAKQSPQGKTHLVDKDFVAVEYAKKNAEINNIKNTQIYLSNGFSTVPEEQFDLIVSNIPAKVGKELYWIMIADMKKYLKPGGRAYFVFISGLKEFFKRNFTEEFGNYKTVASNETYVVGMTTKES